MTFLKLGTVNKSIERLRKEGIQLKFVLEISALWIFNWYALSMICFEATVISISILTVP